MSFLYAGCILSGLYSSIFTKSYLSLIKKFFVFLPLFCLVMFSFITNGRGAILYGATLFIGSWVVSKIAIQESLIKLLNFKNLIRICLISASIIAMLFYIQMIRFGDSFVGDVVQDFIKVYFFGYLSGYSYWFDNYSSFSTNIFSHSALFGGFYKLLGLEAYSPDNYQPKYIFLNLETNVDTIFSEILIDFGKYFGLVFSFFSGLISGILYKLLREGSFLSFPFICFIYCTIIWSWVTSLGNYTTIIFAFCQIFFLFLLIEIFFLKYKLQIR